MNVDDCNFEGHFYFCNPTEEAEPFPMWLIGAAAGGVLILLLLLLLLCWRMKKKKEENKEFDEQEEQITQQYNLLHSKNTNTRFNKSRLSYYDRETSFMGGRASVDRGTSAWGDSSESGMDGRASQATISSRFFESPMMFLSDDTSSRPGSRGKSPFFGKNSKAVSPTPQSISVAPPSKVPDKFKNKSDFTGVKTEGKGTFSAVSKLISKARMDLPPSSPHPEPVAGGASSAYSQGPLFTKRDSMNSIGTISPPMSPTEPISPSKSLVFFLLYIVFTSNGGS